jgi:hypothetical protein
MRGKAECRHSAASRLSARFLPPGASIAPAIHRERAKPLVGVNSPIVRMPDRSDHVRVKAAKINAEHACKRAVEAVR